MRTNVLYVIILQSHAFYFFSPLLFHTFKKRPMTQTSSFGTSKREGHDSSSFYERNLYSRFFREPASAKELAVPMPDLDGWVDNVYRQSSTAMTQVPDNSVALAFTSPPYNVGKDYDDDMGFNEYLALIRDVGKEVYRVLKPGGRYVVNIANLGRKPYIPLHSFFYGLHAEELGFLPMGEIIWQKGRGASGSCAWGSWRSAKAPCLRDLHEYLLVFAKQSYSRPDKGESTIERDEFMAATLSIWEIPPESAKRVGYPAPFPVELASRGSNFTRMPMMLCLIHFWSGTTCVAAKQLGRH
ncbi:MAG: site-specific DNA-methyltransferase [Caldilineaceae bacterium]